LNVAAEDVPEFVTVAGEPGERVVVVPAAIVAAEPVGPVAPGVPSSIDRLAGAVDNTSSDRLLSVPSTVTVRDPKTSEETVMLLIVR
jgi:hypothetical protein